MPYIASQWQVSTGVFRVMLDPIQALSGPSMIVDLSTFLANGSEQVAQHLRTPRLLKHVASPLLKFIPCDSTSTPQQWEEGTYWFTLRFLGFIPLGKQAVVISYPEGSQNFIMRDNGYSALVKQWDHTITLESSGAGTLYRDRVLIDAGVFTLFVWAFAQVFYRHRQRRLRKLVANGFRYPAS